MASAEEEQARAGSLEDAVQTAEAAGLPIAKVAVLREIVCRFTNSFRYALRGDPPASVEPLTVTLKPGAKQSG